MASHCGGPGLQLAAGLDWVERKGLENIYKHEVELPGLLQDGLANSPDLVPSFCLHSLIRRRSHGRDWNLPTPRFTAEFVLAGDFSKI